MKLVTDTDARRPAISYLRPDHRVVLALIDDAGGRQLILEGLGRDYRVTIASTALEADPLLARFTYQLVIVTNFGMPPTHAVSVIPADHPYPVLFISGVFDDDLRRECALKRIRFLKMPFTLTQLRAEVAATLSDGGLTRKKHLGTMSASPSGPGGKPVKKRKAKNGAPSPICPKCKSGDGRPIVYGYPGAEAMEAADQGKVILGGCVLSGDDPHWQCSRCGDRW